MARKTEYVDEHGNILNEDDIVIAPMDVEGMPWHDTKTRRQKQRESLPPMPPPPHQSRRELLGTVFRTTLLAILVALGFIAVGALGILLLLRLWA